MTIPEANPKKRHGIPSNTEPSLFLGGGHAKTANTGPPPSLAAITDVNTGRSPSLLLFVPSRLVVAILEDGSRPTSFELWATGEGAYKTSCIESKILTPGKSPHTTMGFFWMVIELPVLWNGIMPKYPQQYCTLVYGAEAGLSYKIASLSSRGVSTPNVVLRIRDCAGLLENPVVLMMSFAFAFASFFSLANSWTREHILVRDLDSLFLREERVNPRRNLYRCTQYCFQWPSRTCTCT
mmetsp:Transcript_28625/g.52301  ORF Transcript_28625/g.52301 Transcript_28625/m.52301 type:complete len:238 (+) Transcript_28625:1077-1790(+)